MLVLKFEERSADPRVMESLYLQTVEIEIIGSERSVKGTRQQISFWAATGFENIGQGFDAGTSDLGTNGEVFIYKSGQTTLHLTKDKLQDLILRDLSAMDYFALVQKVGYIQELDSEFYDEETGMALLPIKPKPPAKPKIVGTPPSVDNQAQGDLFCESADSQAQSQPESQAETQA